MSERKDKHPSGTLDTSGPASLNHANRLLRPCLPTSGCAVTCSYCPLRIPCAPSLSSNSLAYSDSIASSRDRKFPLPVAITMITHDPLPPRPKAPKLDVDRHRTGGVGSTSIELTVGSCLEKESSKPRICQGSLAFASRRASHHMRPTWFTLHRNDLRLMRMDSLAVSGHESALGSGTKHPPWRRGPKSRRRLWNPSTMFSGSIQCLSIFVKLTSIARFLWCRQLTWSR